MYYLDAALPLTGWSLLRITLLSSSTLGIWMSLADTITSSLLMLSVDLFVPRYVACCFWISCESSIYLQIVSVISNIFRALLAFLLSPCLCSLVLVTCSVSILDIFVLVQGCFSCLILLSAKCWSLIVSFIQINGSFSFLRLWLVFS